MLKQTPSEHSVNLGYGLTKIAPQVTYLNTFISAKSSSNPIAKRDSDHTYPSTKSQLLPSKTASKQLYFDLTRQRFTQHDRLLSQLFLNEKLLAVEDMESDLPANIDDVIPWMAQNNVEVGNQYQDYLAYRKNGGKRQLFTTKSHAYYFLQSVAPTKLVDGSWLYGLCDLWQDHRFSNLIKTYLEELGEGDTAKNHVVLYKKLLAAHDSEQWKHLSDEYFTQGAIQLALGYNASQYIPEVIGFNLGYEQLPLHLLITAYELKELGINPYYFTLHVTVDNASTGHAKKALQALFETMPALANTEEFYRRVNNGYKLNQLGINTNTAIASFDLDREFLNILKSKSLYGQRVHSDKCLFNGRTINEWLSDPSRIPEFVSSLIEHGWIKRDQDPHLSRFWKLIEGDTAKMFGVFSGYEKQVIYDWIAGKQYEKFIHTQHIQSKSNVTYLHANLHTHLHAPSKSASESTTSGSTDQDVLELEKKLASMESIEAIMNVLVPLISPAIHHTPVGLMATQLYKSLMYKSPNTHF